MMLVDPQLGEKRAARMRGAKNSGKRDVHVTMTCPVGESFLFNKKRILYPNDLNCYFFWMLHWNNLISVGPASIFEIMWRFSFVDKSLF